MADQRSTRVIAAGLEASKAARRALWIGVLSPILGVVVGSFAANDASLSRALPPNAVGPVAFILVGLCAFAPAAFARARAPQHVRTGLLVGGSVTLAVLSLGAIGLGAEEMTETAVAIGALWIAVAVGLLTGHAFGGLLAARRAEGSEAKSAVATLSDTERRALIDLEYATRGWVVPKITRTYTSSHYALEVELDTQVLRNHGYRATSRSRLGASAATNLIGAALGSGSEPQGVQVTFERDPGEGEPGPEATGVWTSEWEKHGPSRDP